MDPLARSKREYVDSLKRPRNRLLLGPITYEIDYLHQRADPDKVPVAFRLELINPKTLDELDGQPIQYVPTRPGRPTAPNGLSYVTPRARAISIRGSPPFQRISLNAACVVG